MADDLVNPAAVTAKTLSAAQALVECLVLNGVEKVFLVPGESYLAVIDALFDQKDRIEVITCRHEAGAANMAVANARLTGTTGVVMVTRGPGAAHASIGIHNAEQDSAPVIMFVGQVAAGHRGRAAFQEIDYAQMFGGICKLALEIDRADRTVELVNRAFVVAQSGRPGPIVIALPEDVLHLDAGPQPPVAAKIARAAFPQETLPAIAAMLGKAKRPLMILGGVGWTNEARETLEAWARSTNLPVALSFRRKDLIDNASPVYIGDLGLGPNPKLIARAKSADMLLVVGARLGENASQAYTLFTPQHTARHMAHIHQEPQELGRVWPAAVVAASDLSAAALALATIKVAPFDPAWVKDAKADYDAFTRPVETTGAVNMSRIVAHLAEGLADDVIICNGAGNFAAWLHRFYRHRKMGTQLAPVSGGMGFGLPAAVGAKITYPHREVVAWTGDGDFLMSGSDLATAVQYGANIIAVVVDNGSYGTIRMHQERDFPDRTIGTDLNNPDFAAYARSFGAWAVTVERTEDFPQALAQARAAGRPALIHIKMALEDISPGKTLKMIHGTGVGKH